MRSTPTAPNSPREIALGEVAPDDLPNLPVLLTVVDGEIVFQAEA
jgi:hypothetical protein